MIHAPIISTNKKSVYSSSRVGFGVKSQLLFLFIKQVFRVKASDTQEIYTTNYISSRFVQIHAKVCQVTVNLEFKSCSIHGYYSVCYHLHKAS